MPKNSKGREIAEVITKKCSGCQACLGECPVEAVDIVDGVAKIDAEKCIGCGKCVLICPAEAILFEKPLKKKAGTAAHTATSDQKVSDIGDYKGVAVFIETRDGVPAEVSWELVGKARELAEKLDTQVMGFLVGNDVQNIAQEAIFYGCDIVYVMENPLFQVYVSKVFGDALTQMCRTVKPEIFQ